MASPAVPVSTGSIRSHSIDTGNFRLTEAWFPAGLVLRPHTHDRAILAVMIQGGFRTRIARRDFPCHSTYAWTEPLAERHENHIGREGAHSLVLQPDPRNTELLRPFARLLDEVHLLRHPAVLVETPRILAEIRRPDAFSALCAEAHVMLLLSGAARLRVRDGNGHRAPLWLTRARELLHDDWRRTASLSKIAHAVGVHPCYLAHVFRDYYRESVGSYVRKLRLNWAMMQLATPERSISQIAVEAGYSDQSHFTRECRKYIGTTPAAYRARVSLERVA